MKVKNIITVCSLVLCSLAATAENITIDNGGWSITLDGFSNTFSYGYKGKTILKKVVPEVKYEKGDRQEKYISSTTSNKVTFTERAVANTFGKGKCYTFAFEDTVAKVTMSQKFYIYKKLPYVITELILSGDEILASNYLAPIVSTEKVELFPASEHNRVLFVPWDNDGFIRYDAHKLAIDVTSYEVTTLYDGISRNGLVLGSIEHDIWKSAIKVKASDHSTIQSISCYSGASSNITRDKLPHGKVSGKSVKSAKMLIGVFDDWREGMNVYGEANTKITPIRSTWKKGAPVGWNSWAVLANYLNYDAAVGASDFFRNTLKNEGFCNKKGNVIMDLDSFWDNMTEAQLKQYTENCKKNGQVAGIYWCPFSYWGSNGDADVEGTNGKYKYKDCFIYVNGERHKQGGLCLDPTHPAVKERIAHQFKKFKEWGFHYVKLDFVTDGAVQSDSYYNKNVTTATQAYNEGFNYLAEVAGEDMFLSLSIAPLFPYQYGNSRRVSCDAWGTIGHTEYVMNAISNGWWTEKLFQFNDPDHIVLQNEKESESENRARITTGMVTGMMLLGDNFSTTEPSKRGNAALSIERARKLLNNKDIYEVAHLEQTFIPVYGYKSFKNTHYGAESVFSLTAGKTVYVACFNYDKENGALQNTIAWSLLNVNPDKIKSIKEIWTQETLPISHTGLPAVIPAADARVYKVTLK